MNPPDQEPPSTGARKWTWLFVLGAVLIVVGPILARGVPAEIARWYAAAAAEAELDGDDPRAVQRLGQALRWRPDDPDLLVHRAELRLRWNDRAGSLADCERALQLTTGGQQVEALEQRIAVYQRMGNHKAALQDADRLLELVAAAPNRELDLGRGRILSYPGALNNRAYACALAEQKVEQGLEDIQQAFDVIGSEEDYCASGRAVI